MDKDKFKKISISFFHWWWNEGGTNTEQGFDTWWNKRVCEHCYSSQTTIGDGGKWCDDCGKLTKKI